MEQPSAVQSSPVRLVQVADCGGRTWWLSPTQRTIYYLDSLSPASAAHAIMQAVEALAAYDARPNLRLVHSDPERAVS